MRIMVYRKNAQGYRVIVRPSPRSGLAPVMVSGTDGAAVQAEVKKVISQVIGSPSLPAPVPGT